MRGNGDSAPAMAGGRMRAKANMLRKTGRAIAQGLVAPASAGAITAMPDASATSVPHISSRLMPSRITSRLPIG